MNPSSTSSVPGRSLRPVPLAAVAAFLLTAAATPVLRAAETAVEIGPAAARSGAPRWDARGLGPLPRQGIACLDATEDGRWIAVGTIAPPGDPNMFLLDGDGKPVGQHRAGQRWVNEVSVSSDGRFVAGLCTTPEGTAGDATRFFGFSRGDELDRAGPFAFRDFHPGGFLFHYGDHSNHLPRISRRAGDRWIVAGDDLVWWLSPGDATASWRANLGSGVTTAMAASPGGLVAVGRYAFPFAYTPREAADGAGGLAVAARPAFRNLIVLRPDRAEPIVWSRPVDADVVPSPEPEKGVYGPPAPPWRDVKFQAPLALAVDAAGERIAVADYQGWQRVFQPRDGSEEIPFGTRFLPSRPTIHVYTADGKTVRRLGGDALPPFWCDLAFSADSRKLLISPHGWTCRGLGGQPFLPADEDARTLFVLDVAGGGLRAVRFPDVISSVDAGGPEGAAVGCWDHKVYLLDGHYRPIRGLPDGLDVGAASLVRVSRDGERIAVATAAGTVRMLDAGGKEIWRTDLDAAARPGVKPWTKDQKADRLHPGIWRTNGGLAHSDMGSQMLVEAPRGLILIDPNSGASFEQNWARIQGAGFDPMGVKYVLPTHEHGDHAPGAALWRVVTGAQVVASAEMAYVLQHHIPGGTGYGFHPPVPADIVLTEDRELELAGLKVKALHLPGHTFGSMGYAFRLEGRTYVATGDLIMPGGLLGYSGSLDFSAEDVLRSLEKLAALRPDVVLGGHGGGDPDDFIAKGISAGAATGWGRMAPPRPDPFFGFGDRDYLIAAWLEPILSAAYGDIDGDGKPDVAVLVPRGKGSAVKVYLNEGGRFPSRPDVVVDLPSLRRGWKLRLLQTGRRRVADLFVSSEGEAVLLRAQGGKMEYRCMRMDAIRATQVLPGDFHGGGRGDLLIGSRFVAGCSLATEREDGALVGRQTGFPARIYFDIALADVDGDGRDDLIASCGDVFLRRQDGSFSETPSFRLAAPPGEPEGWAFMAAAEFDGDGRPDVALLSNGKAGALVWLYRNRGDPREPFAAQPDAAFQVPVAEVNRDGPVAADFDGDGLPDLILAARGDGPGACALTGSRTDGLSPGRTITVKLDYVPHFDTRFGVADFDGDGKADLAGFGFSPTGAPGVYIRLRHPGAR